MAEVNRREIYRYLGIKGQQEPDLQTKALVEDCLEELERSVNCRSFYRRYPLTLLPDSELDFTCFKVKSRALSRNLKDCQVSSFLRRRWVLVWICFCADTAVFR